MKIGFLGLLGIVFIVLKLTDVIDWHWALVLLPFSGVIVALTIMLIGLCVVYITLKRKKDE